MSLPNSHLHDVFESDASGCWHATFAGPDAGRIIVGESLASGEGDYHIAPGDVIWKESEITRTILVCRTTKIPVPVLNDVQAIESRGEVRRP